MTPQPEYAVFYALHAAAEAARVEWVKWEQRSARNGVKTTADFHMYYRAKDEYAAAVVTMYEFYARMDADARAVAAA